MLTAVLFNMGDELWGKKWRKPIMVALLDGPLRFSEIKKLLPNCSVKVLSEALQEMERDKLIIRKQYPTIPVKVTYELSGDIQDIVKLLPHYENVLVEYFYKNAARLNLSQEVTNQLQALLITKE